MQLYLFCENARAKEKSFLKDENFDRGAMFDSEK